MNDRYFVRHSSGDICMTSLSYQLEYDHLVVLTPDELISRTARWISRCRASELMSASGHPLWLDQNHYIYLSCAIYGCFSWFLSSDHRYLDREKLYSLDDEYRL